MIIGPQKGPAKRGHVKTSKIVKHLFWHFSTLSRRANNVKNYIKIFFEDFRAAPILRPLLEGSHMNKNKKMEMKRCTLGRKSLALERKTCFWFLGSLGESTLQVGKGMKDSTRLLSDSLWTLCRHRRSDSFRTLGVQGQRLFSRPHPQHSWDFPEEILEKSERTRKRSQSFSWNSPREYGWDPPNPIIQGIWSLHNIPEFSPPRYSWGRLFFQKWFRRGPLRAGHGILNSTEGIFDFLHKNAC